MSEDSASEKSPASIWAGVKKGTQEAISDKVKTAVGALLTLLGVWALKLVPVVGAYLNTVIELRIVYLMLLTLAALFFGFALRSLLVQHPQQIAAPGKGQIKTLENQKELVEWVCGKIEEVFRMDEAVIKRDNESNRKTFSLVIVGIDSDFEQRSKDYGRAAINNIISEVGEIAGRECRGNDLLARHDEQFIIIAQFTGSFGARKLADRIRGKVEGTHFPILGKPDSTKLTASAGVAEVDMPRGQAEGLETRAHGVINQARTALKKALDGGNQVLDTPNSLNPALNFEKDAHLSMESRELPGNARNQPSGCRPSIYVWASMAVAIIAWVVGQTIILNQWPPRQEGALWAVGLGVAWLSGVWGGYDAARTRILRLAKLAATDDLTGLFNRRELEKQLKQKLSASIQFQQSLSMIILDIDNFKQINDTAGYAFGDEALRRVAGIIQAECRPADTAFRYKFGDEFLILLSTTSASGAEQLAEKLRMRIAQTPISLHEQTRHLTISAGVSESNARGGQASQLESLAAEFEQRAVSALASAKEGKNRVVVFTSSP